VVVTKVGGAADPSAGGVNRLPWKPQLPAEFADEQHMASEDGNLYRMDPAEMLWQCSVCLACAGEDVVVEISKGTDGASTSPLSAGQVASAHSPGLHPAHPHAA
jgi:hypothetical protein